MLWMLSFELQWNVWNVGSCVWSLSSGDGEKGSGAQSRSSSCAFSKPLQCSASLRMCCHFARHMCNVQCSIVLTISHSVHVDLVRQQFVLQICSNMFAHTLDLVRKPDWQCFSLGRQLSFLSFHVGKQYLTTLHNSPEVPQSTQKLVPQVGKQYLTNLHKMLQENIWEYVTQGSVTLEETTMCNVLEGSG